MNDVAERAAALVGCRFRAQGREASEGLDCIGLVAAASGIPSAEIPRDYRLWSSDLGRLREQLDRHFTSIPPRLSRSGDVLLFAVATDRLHLGVRSEAGFIHAHAGVGRVVETPWPADWPILAAYRIRVRSKAEH